MTNAAKQEQRVCCKCGETLPATRRLKKCQPCQREQIKWWRENIGNLTNSLFQGVDIDAIHRKWKNR